MNKINIFNKMINENEPESEEIYDLEKRKVQAKKLMKQFIDFKENIMSKL